MQTTQITQRTVPYNATKWTQTGPSVATHPGGVYRDQKGVTWYVKVPANEEIAWNEILSWQLYRLCGINVPDMRLISIGGKIGTASRFVPDSRHDPELLHAQPKDIMDGFAVDAWLANWDVFGIDQKNIVFDEADRAYRVDFGGALRFRAQGTPKGKCFDATVTELSLLRRSEKNPVAARVFGRISVQEIKASAKRLVFIPDHHIAALVEKFGPKSPDERKDLLDQILARRDFVMDQIWPGEERRQVLEDESDSDWGIVRQVENRRHMENELAYCLFTHGIGRKCNRAVQNWNQGDRTIRGIASWLIKTAFSIERFPWHADYVSTQTFPVDEMGKIRTFLETFRDPIVLEDVRAELQEMYRHTQNVFRKAGITYFRLVRSLEDNGTENYATRLVNMVEAAKYLQLNTIKIPFDVVTSWGYSKYARGIVHVDMWIPATDILWGDPTVASDGGPNSNAIERSEWLVASRSPDGMFEIPVNAVTCDDIVAKSKKRFVSEDEARDFLAEYTYAFVQETSIYKINEGRSVLEVTLRGRLRRAWAFGSDAWRALSSKMP